MIAGLLPPWPLAVALFLFAWPLALYPALLFLRARLVSAPQTPRLPGHQLPPVALIICALNEEKVIGGKLRNCLELDYPPDRLRILVVSDGSTDRTTEIVQGFAAQGVELIAQPVRRGKVTNLNEVIPARTEPVVVLSDANVIYHPQALKRLLARLADPAIGCVSGKVVLVETVGALRGGEENYYSLEWLLQEQASQIHSMVGADGAMYALRRELFRPCPPDTLIEDLIMAVQIVNQGYRAVMEPSALAWEEGPKTRQEEYRRKVRIAAGAAQAVLRGNGLPGGRAPFVFWLIFLSHKLLRWLAPVSGLAVIVIAAWCWPHPWGLLCLGGAAMLAALAGIRLLSGRQHPVLDAAYYFLFGQIAVLHGLWRGCTGRQSVLWAKANR